MSWLEIIVIAIIQGATEFFPVSSLGHAVIIPGFFGWEALQSDPGFLAFLVILHFGTAISLLAYFWRDWIGLLAAFSPRPSVERRRAQRLILMLVIGTIPVAVLGLAFNHAVKVLFATPIMASIFLIANGALLYFGDRPVRHPRADLDHITWRQALFVGLMQCLALLPGISRSGASIIGGLMIGLTEAEAAHLSFLLATPAIFGAGVLEIPKLMRLEQGVIDPMGALAGAVIAGLFAYASIIVLMRWLKGHNLHALRPFAGYCAALGLASLIFYALKA
jgi:undecaprenyl-diphosphatase